jgi:hypothetical protein
MAVLYGSAKRFTTHNLSPVWLPIYGPFFNCLFYIDIFGWRVGWVPPTIALRWQDDRRVR